MGTIGWHERDKIEAGLRLVNIPIVLCHNGPQELWRTEGAGGGAPEWSGEGHTLIVSPNNTTPPNIREVCMRPRNI